MSELKYIFDINKGLSELNKLFDLLHKYYEYIPADPNELKILSDSNKKKDNQIQELSKEKEDLQKKIQEYSILESKYNNLIHQNQEKEKEITEEKEKEIASLTKTIENLRKRLSVYEPSPNDNIESDLLFFNIDKEHGLKRTMNASAPFVGKVKNTGNVSFTFNVDKGPHKQYSQNPSELESLCEIIDRTDNANHISLGKWGEGVLANNYLYVTKKAQIKLTRE